MHHTSLARVFPPILLPLYSIFHSPKSNLYTSLSSVWYLLSIILTLQFVHTLLSTDITFGMSYSVDHGLLSISLIQIFVPTVHEQSCFYPPHVTLRPCHCLLLSSFSHCSHAPPSIPHFRISVITHNSVHQPLHATFPASGCAPQRAYFVLFSPLYHISAVHPPPSIGHTWLHSVFSILTLYWLHSPRLLYSCHTVHCCHTRASFHLHGYQEPHVAVTWKPSIRSVLLSPYCSSCRHSLFLDSSPYCILYSRYHASPFQFS